MLVSVTSAATAASASDGVVANALIAFIERVPVTFAMICTAVLSATFVSVPSEWRVPVCATTTRLCLPLAPAL